LSNESEAVFIVLKFLNWTPLLFNEVVDLFVVSECPFPFWLVCFLGVVWADRLKLEVPISASVDKITLAGNLTRLTLAGLGGLGGGACGGFINVLLPSSCIIKRLSAILNESCCIELLELSSSPLRWLMGRLLWLLLLGLLVLLWVYWRLGRRGLFGLTASSKIILFRDKSSSELIDLIEVTDSRCELLRDLMSTSRLVRFNFGVRVIFKCSN
jgi:hypothetical protein